MYAIKSGLRKTILWASIAWGVMLLVVGFFASFSIGANDTLASLSGFFLIFMLPIIASIAARWIPLISGVVLLASFIVILVGFYFSGSTMDVLRVLEKVYLWFHVLFGILFVVLAKRRDDAASSPSWSPK